MMCAMTTASQVVLHIFLPVQIGTALIILSGISLGPEAGFLIGALSRLVCNFYMGQGPWTPWQMFCWGILGFLAGFAFHVGQSEQLHARRFAVVASAGRRCVPCICRQFPITCTMQPPPLCVSF